MDTRNTAVPQRRHHSVTAEFGWVTPFRAAIAGTGVAGPSRLVGILLLLAICQPAPAGASTPNPTLQFFVSTFGNDAWSGQLADPNAAQTDGPFATLERARDAVRNLNVQHAFPSNGVTVAIRGGIYYRNTTFALGASDSGTPAFPIAYSAYSNEIPTIVGGIPLNGFQPVTNQQILARLSPAARTNVLQITLRAAGCTNLGILSRHGYSITWTNGQAELYFQEHSMQLARYPNSGWLLITSPSLVNANSFSFSSGKSTQWGDTNDIWAHGYWAKDWADSCENVGSVDLIGGAVILNSPGSRYGYKTGGRFYFLNILEELDSPGEYFIDRKAGNLYFWPPSNIATGSPFLSTVDGIIQMQSVSYMIWSGITFEGAKLGLVSINGGHSNYLTNCIIRGSARNGVTIYNSPGSGVANCEVTDIGEIAVLINASGIRTNLTSGNNFVLSTRIHHFGRLSWTYHPGICLSGVGVHLANNLIYDAPHNGILLFGNDHLIAYNEIHHVCTETADAGAIYMGNDWTMRGNVFQYNYLHDINIGNGATDPGGVVGIYLDDCFSGATIYGNIFCSVDCGVLVGGGRDNLVQNNIFANCGTYSISADQRLLSWEASQLTTTNSTLLTTLAAMPYQAPPWSVRYPPLVNILNDEPAEAKGNVISDNVQYQGKWTRLSDNVQSVLTITNNFISGDPLFLDYSNRIFQLGSNSPVWAMGFQPIPLKKIGLPLFPPKTLKAQ